MKTPVHTTHASGDVISASLNEETQRVQSLTVISPSQKPGLRALAQMHDGHRESPGQETEKQQ